MVTFEPRGSRVILNYPFSREINSLVKAVPGWQFDGDTKQWSIPATGVEQFLGLCRDAGVATGKIDLDALPICRLSNNEIREMLLDGRAVVFDIETYEHTPSESGKVDPLHHAIVCASVAYRAEDGEWTVTQWFAHKKEEEKDVCEAVAEFLQKFEVILTYNGDHFDVPCTNYRMRVHGIPYRIPLEKHVDLIRYGQMFKDQGIIPNAKLGTLEKAFGIDRIDELPGAAVVPLYNQYLKDPDPEIPRLILQHNEEDVLYLARDMAPKLLEGFVPEPLLAVDENQGASAAELVDEYLRWYQQKNEADKRLKELRPKILELTSGQGAIPGNEGMLVISLYEDIDENIALKFLSEDNTLAEYMVPQDPVLDKAKIKADILSNKLPERYREALVTRKRITARQHKK